MIDKSYFDQLYKYVVERVGKESGNVFCDKNKSMVESRICRRMLMLRIDSMRNYHNYIMTHEKEEMEYLVGLLTTHHTFFFREIVHFEYIEENLEKIVANARAQGRKKINIWSSACSRGHEVYSLAAFVDYHLKTIAPEMDFYILGTDIDIESVQISEKGVYKYRDVKQIPQQYLTGYWQRGKGANESNVRISPDIKAKCEFRKGNLLEDQSELHKKFDIIFCRNALIYFDQNNIRKIVGHLLKCLVPKGLLFTGVSEPVGDMGIPVTKVGPCVYHRNRDLNYNEIVSIEKEVQTNEEEEVKALDVVLVDDSKSVLKVLGKIFEGSDRINVVGQCENGQELKDFLSKNKVDAVTLDLHMPVMDGVTYLKDNFGPDHPTVVVVSSVNRDDLTLAKQAVEYGAYDYVEKPSLQNMKECQEELINKVILACKETDKKRTDKSETKPKAEVKSEVVELSSIPTKKHSTTSLYHNENANVEKYLTKIDLYLFADNSDSDELKQVLHELYDLDVMPKAIVTNRNATKLQSELSEFNYSFTKLKKGSDESILLTDINDFLLNHTGSLNYHNQILCFFKGTDFAEHLPARYIPKNYLLADNGCKVQSSDFHVMPAPSWAFHIKEKFDEFSLRRNRLYYPRQLKKYGYFVKEGESLIGLYNPDESLYGLMISNNVKEAIATLKTVNDSLGVRLVGSNLVTKSLNASLPSNLKLTKKLERNFTFRFGCTGKKIIVGKRKVEKKVAGNISISKNSSSGKKKVLIVDDSKVFAKILNKQVDTNKFDVVGEVYDPLQLDKKIKEVKPDVITLDVNMPGINGVEAYRTVISKHKVPTIVVTSSFEDSEDVIKLLSLGVVDYIQKPSSDQLTTASFPLNEKLELATKAKVLDSSTYVTTKLTSSKFLDVKDQSLIAIGSSTGGTRAILDLFKSFPNEIPPVVIAQHIPPYFSSTFANSLNDTFPFKVAEAKHGDVVQSNHVYIAPGGKNMTIERDGGMLKISISNPKSDHNFVPNVDYMFHSVSKLKKMNICALLLTGMGKDGALGIGSIKNAGGYTIAQDEESCVVYGMPKAAYDMGNVHEQANLGTMANKVFTYLDSKSIKKVS